MAWDPLPASLLSQRACFLSLLQKPFDPTSLDDGGWKFLPLPVLPFVALAPYNLPILPILLILLKRGGVCAFITAVPISCSRLTKDKLLGIRFLGNYVIYYSVAGSRETL